MVNNDCIIDMKNSTKKNESDNFFRPDLTNVDATLFI